MSNMSGLEKISVDALPKAVAIKKAFKALGIKTKELVCSRGVGGVVISAKGVMLYIMSRRKK